MDNLQELSNQLDSIKTKLTDKEYKDLMELSKKIYDTKDKKYVKCLVGKIKLNIYEKDDEENMEMYILGNCYKHISYEQAESHQVFITPNISFEEKIFEVREMPCACAHLSIIDSWMCDTQYDMLKKDKYDRMEKIDPDNNDYDILVYLGDM
jgi:ribosome-binding factor A